MDKKTRLIIIGVLSIIIVILLSLGLTKAFMKPVEQGGNLTEISLESCAKIKLTGTSSINLSSSYPMSRNRGLQTTPYSLTVTSYCDSYVGFNLYIATLNTNTLTDENIHYILTEKGSKTAVVEGILSSATDGSSEFSTNDKTELNTGLKGTYSKIYKIHNTTVSLKGNKQYDLYLFVDESSTNRSMNKTFKAGVAVKAYDRESNLADWVIAQYNGIQGNNNIYYHDSSLTNGAGDNSYRYAGGDYVLTEKATTAGMKSLTSSTDTETDGITNFYCDGERQYLYDLSCDTNSQTYYFTLQYDTTNTQYQTYNEALEKAVSDGYLTKDNIKNFVCFGSDSVTCPEENLYRIIGVFDNKVKLMKYTYNTKEQLGEDGGFSETYTLADYGLETTYRGSSITLDLYYWNASTKKNTWSESLLNKTNLNTNFINNIGTEWANKIATTTWKVGGNTTANIRDAVPSTAYQNEVVNPVTTNTTDNATTYSAKVGLIYASDYGFAASPSAWTTTLVNYDGYDNNNVAIKDTNWMFIDSDDWTISRNAEYLYDAFSVDYDGNVKDDSVYFTSGVRASFSLDSSVSYVSGSGSMSDPIVIN